MAKRFSSSVVIDLTVDENISAISSSSKNKIDIYYDLCSGDDRISSPPQVHKRFPFINILQDKVSASPSPASNKSVNKTLHDFFPKSKLFDLISPDTNIEPYQIINSSGSKDKHIDRPSNLITVPQCTSSSSNSRAVTGHPESILENYMNIINTNCSRVTSDVTSKKIDKKSSNKNVKCSPNKVVLRKKHNKLRSINSPSSKLPTSYIPSFKHNTTSTSLPYADHQREILKSSPTICCPNNVLGSIMKSHTIPLTVSHTPVTTAASNNNSASFVSTRATVPTTSPYLATTVTENHHITSCISTSGTTAGNTHFRFTSPPTPVINTSSHHSSPAPAPEAKLSEDTLSATTLTTIIPKKKIPFIEKQTKISLESNNKANSIDFNNTENNHNDNNITTGKNKTPNNITLKPFTEQELSSDASTNINRSNSNMNITSNNVAAQISTTAFTTASTTSITKRITAKQLASCSSLVQQELAQPHNTTLLNVVHMFVSCMGFYLTGSLLESLLVSLLKYRTTATATSKSKDRLIWNTLCCPTNLQVLFGILMLPTPQSGKCIHISQPEIHLYLSSSLEFATSHLSQVELQHPKEDTLQELRKVEVVLRFLEQHQRQHEFPSTTSNNNDNNNNNRYNKKIKIETLLDQLMQILEIIRDLNNIIVHHNIKTSNKNINALCDTCKIIFYRTVRILSFVKYFQLTPKELSYLNTITQSSTGNTTNSSGIKSSISNISSTSSTSNTSTYKNTRKKNNIISRSSTIERSYQISGTAKRTRKITSKMQEVISAAGHDDSSIDSKLNDSDSSYSEYFEMKRARRAKPTSSSSSSSSKYDTETTTAATTCRKRIKLEAIFGSDDDDEY